MKYGLMMLVTVTMIGMLGLTACGSDTDDVPSLRTGVEAQEVEPTVSAADKVLDNEANLMAFTQCLRDQGIEVLDPVVDSDGNLENPELAEGAETGMKDWGPVWEACAEHLEGFVYEKERVDMSEQVDQWVAVAACLGDSCSAHRADRWHHRRVVHRRYRWPLSRPQSRSPVAYRSAPDHVAAPG